MEKKVILEQRCPVEKTKKFYAVPEFEVDHFKDCRFRLKQAVNKGEDYNLILSEFKIFFSNYQAKILLLDIDYTLFDGDTPRPHLKEFIEYVNNKYEVRFYTAATTKRVADVTRILKHDLNIDEHLVQKLNRFSLTRENCSMVEISSGATVKCLDKAAKYLNVDVNDLILLDDNPSFDNPRVEQVIQAEGWMKDMENDNYLTRTGL